MSECKREYPDCGSPTACDMCQQLEIMQEEKQELLEAAEEALKYFKDKISKMDDINEDEEAPEWVIIPMKLENAIKKAEGDNDRY